MRRFPENEPVFVPIGAVNLGPVLVEPADDNDQLQRISAAVQCASGSFRMLRGSGATLEQAVAELMSPLLRKPILVTVCLESTGAAVTSTRSHQSVHVHVHESQQGQPVGEMAQGAGAAPTREHALVAAVLRALHHSPLLKAEFRNAGQREIYREARQLSAEIVTALGLPELDESRLSKIVEIVSDHMNRFAVGQVIATANASDPVSRLRRYDATCLFTDRDGHIMDRDTDTDEWWRWYPGLANDDLTLAQVLETMPAAPPSDIPWVVRLFENPKSWLRLRGAIELKPHDILHVALGRGLLDQDEAFVIGFTMGTTKNLTRLERRAFKWIVSHLYPEPYRIPPELLAAYDLGAEAGKQMGTAQIFKQRLEELLPLPLGTVRKRLQIDTAELRGYYAREKQRIPGTLASARLASATQVETG